MEELYLKHNKSEKDRTSDIVTKIVMTTTHSLNGSDLLYMGNFFQIFRKQELW